MTNFSLSICSTDGNLTTHIVCTNNGELRLSGGSTAMQGRVEICWNGVWGTVCDEQFDSTEAQVVCAQLNYPTTGQYHIVCILYSKYRIHLYSKDTVFVVPNACFVYPQYICNL